MTKLEQEHYDAIRKAEAYNWDEIVKACAFITRQKIKDMLEWYFNGGAENLKYESWHKGEEINLDQLINEFFENENKG